MNGTIEIEFNRNNFQLSEHFGLDEFSCKGKSCCGHAVKLDSRLVDLLEKVRNRIKTPMTITSGYRCKKHNTSLKNSSPISQHLDGTAADIACPTTMNLQRLCDIFVTEGAVRTGIYTKANFIHVSVENQRKNGRICSRTWRIA